MGPPTAARPRPGRRLAAACAALPLGLLAGELGLRALGVGAHAYVWPPGLETRFDPTPGLLPGVTGPSRFAVGALGLRAGPLPARPGPRILALGGSTTECLYLDQEEAWPRRLEIALQRSDVGPDAWVGNAGVSGRTTRDHVVQLPRLLGGEVRFDLVLALVGVNDLALVLSRDAAYDPDFLARPGSAAALLPRAFAVLPLAETPGPWWKRTALFRLASGLLRRASGDRAQDPRGERYRSWRANRRESPHRRATLPDLGPALGEFRANVSALAAACEQAGAELVLVTPPALWKEDLPPELEARLWMGWVGPSQDEPGLPYYEAGALARGLARYAEVLRELAHEHGLPLVDLAPLDGDPAVFYDDVHFSEEGARRVAELVLPVVRDALRKRADRPDR